jgi:hypothetical protein
MFPYHFHHSRGGESEEETTGLTEGEGIANQRESRGEGGYPACAAAVDLWWEANVCPPVLPFYKAAHHLCLELESSPG